MRVSDDTFGRRLKELRQAAKLTQPRLAERAGMSAMGLAQLEQARRQPSWSTVQALADALGVPVTAFREPPAKRPR